MPRLVRSRLLRSRAICNDCKATTPRSGATLGYAQLYQTSPFFLPSHRPPYCDARSLRLAAKECELFRVFSYWVVTMLLAPTRAQNPFAKRRTGSDGFEQTEKNKTSRLSTNVYKYDSIDLDSNNKKLKFKRFISSERIFRLLVKRNNRNFYDKWNYKIIHVS